MGNAKERALVVLLSERYDMLPENGIRPDAIIGPGKELSPEKLDSPLLGWRTEFWFEAVAPSVAVSSIPRFNTSDLHDWWALSSLFSSVLLEFVPAESKLNVVASLFTELSAVVPPNPWFGLDSVTSKTSIDIELPCLSYSNKHRCWTWEFEITGIVKILYLSRRYPRMHNYRLRCLQLF